MQFNVRSFDVASGAILERLTEGESEAALRASLQDAGLAVLSIEVARTRSGTSRSGAFDLALFCDELRMLLNSGMSLVEAIDTLTSKQNFGEKYAILLDLRQRLLEGKALSAALMLNHHVFPQLLIASIRASERTSRLEEALSEYIDYERVGSELSKKIISAAIYPVLVVGFGALVSLFMIAYVVPRFAKVYDDFAHSLSFSTRLLVRIGHFADNYLVLIILALGGAIALLVFLYRNGRLKVLCLRMLGRFAIVRHYLRLYQLSRIYQTMSMLLKGGYALSDAIPLAQNLAFEMHLQQRMQGAQGAILEGRRLSAAFAEHGLTDTVTERLLQVGERSGNLAKIMDIIALTYRQEFTLFIERATKVAEPLLLMVVGLMIGAIIILMYMPVFDLAGGI